MASAGTFDKLRDPSEKSLGFMLLAPAFLLLALIVAYPIGKLIFNSFFDLRLSGGGAGLKFKLGLHLSYQGQTKLYDSHDT